MVVCSTPTGPTMTLEEARQVKERSKIKTKNIHGEPLTLYVNFVVWLKEFDNDFELWFSAHNSGFLVAKNSDFVLEQA